MAIQSTTAIATITLQQASSTVTFSGIPSTYRDLTLVSHFNCSADSGIVNLYLNQDTNLSNYSVIYIYGASDNTTASTTYTGSPNGAFVAWARAGLGNLSLNIVDSSTSNKYKLVTGRFDQAGFITSARSLRWNSLSAINTVTLSAPSTTFAAGSTFSLYGRIA